MKSLCNTTQQVDFAGFHPLNRSFYFFIFSLFRSPKSTQDQSFHSSKSCMTIHYVAYQYHSYTPLKEKCSPVKEMVEFRWIQYLYPDPEPMTHFIMKIETLRQRDSLGFFHEWIIDWIWLYLQWRRATLWSWYQQQPACTLSTWLAG